MSAATPDEERESFDAYVARRLEENLREADPFLRWMFDCMVCGERQHEGPCTRTDYPELHGIGASGVRSESCPTAQHPVTGRFLAYDCEIDCLDACAGLCGVGLAAVSPNTEEDN